MVNSPISQTGNAQVLFGKAYRQVIKQPLLIFTFGNYDGTALNSPAQNDLSWRRVMFTRDFFDDG